MVAAFPAQVCRGIQGGGEVAGESGQVREPAASIGRKAPTACDDVLHAAAGVLGAPEVPLGLGQVVDRHVVQVGRQQAGVGEAGEALGGTGTVLALAAGERAEDLHQRIGSRLQSRPAQCNPARHIKGDGHDAVLEGE
ncbi:hypothetical protein C3486_26860 [Streptomyces sp. Ru73]|uniref:hypothetical protein n=1 Tax=Streptomyces sp. Ru73 TaxID=2080748 RepID=UPI000CDE1C88|nr:hypothetical protein [Streptomyces sp. Ru73]POX37714.1 hypothetical protein C3486_26860 [Streptomyces sp. Ru73]